MVRILGLPGYLNNSFILEKQLWHLAPKLKMKDITIDFCQPPILSAKEPMCQAINKSKLPLEHQVYYQWFSPVENEKNENEIAQAADYIDSLLRKNNYQGIMGFSQGCNVLTWYLRNMTYVPVDKVILFSSSDHFLTDGVDKVAVPSFHILGKKDTQYIHQSEHVSELYQDENKIKYYHKSGHVIPWDKKLNETLIYWIEE